MFADPAKVKLVIHPEHGSLATTVAARVAELVRKKPDAVLGLPTGSTPKGIYKELIRLHQTEGLDFSRVRCFNLDEYYPVSPDDPQSYRFFMWKNLFRKINARPENIHIPGGNCPRAKLADHCREYEEKIAAAGGLDLVILGIGRTGHIAFNEPGAPRDSKTRLVRLHPFTRLDAAADFFGEDNVPLEGLTMGSGTILSAKEIIMVALGENKASVIQKAVEGPCSEDMPASLLQEHPNVVFHLDPDSAAGLTRIASPWIVGQNWANDNLFTNDRDRLRAVIWLSERVGKPLMRLSHKDYTNNGLVSLCPNNSQESDKVNRESFKALMSKVRDREELPKGERQILFSPHPDDDVISAGGIFRKLAENGNELHVAYQTSGNIAVFDHDALRYLDFVEKHLQANGLPMEAHNALRDRIENFIATKKPGQMDIPEVGLIKRFIRESEALSGAVHIGLKRENCVFMNLPFYQTGQIEKDPPGERDIQQTYDLLQRIKPHRILAAGDLSDPHGTHRVCLWIIRQAVERLPKSERPIVWLYRGAWQEWPLDKADILIPMTERELALKIEAIFKHQSQKDRAMFPGPDEREFWQRVDMRNRETARRFDALGLPTYHALEAYAEQQW